MKIMMMKNLIRFHFFEPYLDAQDKNEIKRALSFKYLTNGPKLEEFKNKFKKFTNTKFTIGVSNITSVLYLPLKSLDTKKGDEVILSLPLYPQLSNYKQDYVIRTIKKILEN